MANSKSFHLHFKWTISKGRDTYGYNICSLYVHGRKVASCNGGGYDMTGTSLGDWVARQFKTELLKLDKEFTGLTFHDPNYKVDPKVVEAEQKGESLGLERYQDFYKQSSRLPTEKHTIPQIDGACGIESVKEILEACGYEMTRSGPAKNNFYIVSPQAR